MKLDILKNQWLDIVFEGRKNLQTYELREVKQKTTIALILGAIFFSIALTAPLIIDLLPKGAEEDMDRISFTAIKLPPKEEEPKLNVPLHWNHQK
jgi:protein TonB